MRKHKKRITKKTRPLYIFLLVLILLGVLGLTVFFLRTTTFFRSHADLGNIIMLYPNPDTAKNNLQLTTFAYITVAPTPTPTTVVTSSAPPTDVGPPNNEQTCPLDSIKPPGSTCQCIDTNGYACPADMGSSIGVPQCAASGSMTFPMQMSGKWYCTTMGSIAALGGPQVTPPPGCYAACIGKPVIYLYPTKKTLVDVSVKTDGDIFVSNPHYPSGGWKHVTAYPNGDLFYEGQKYNELFYESKVIHTLPTPKTGIIIATNNLASRLTEITTQLGLNNAEQKEFLAYWLPKLRQLHTPYIFFSLLSPEVKESYDHVTISPEPDTRIEFIAYFKPLQNAINVTPLQLPATPPARTGFTEVEWGGTIGQ
ncbi:MAG: hypothetical protein ACREHC_01145 [Candidatus Levyibacteriota bacterium]